MYNFRFWIEFSVPFCQNAMPTSSPGCRGAYLVNGKDMVSENTETEKLSRDWAFMVEIHKQATIHNRVGFFIYTAKK